MIYRVQTKVDGFPWMTIHTIANERVPDFKSKAEALRAIQQWKRFDDPTWARAEYRVVGSPDKKTADRDCSCSAKVPPNGGMSHSHTKRDPANTSKGLNFKQIVSQVRAYVKSQGWVMVGAPVPGAKGIWSVAVRRPDAGPRATIITIPHAEIKRFQEERRDTRGGTLRDARRTAKQKALNALERAWIQHHKGGSLRANHAGNRVPDAMEAAFQAGATEAEINRVMDRAAKVTERHRGEQYRKRSSSRDATPNRNPVCPIGTEVQTLILSQQFFTEKQAASWMRRHGFHISKVDQTKNNWRFRQHEPSNFREGSFRTIRFRPGVEAVIGCPKN